MTEHADVTLARPWLLWAIGAILLASAAGGLSFGLIEQDRYIQVGQRSVAEYSIDAAREAYRPCHTVALPELQQCLGTANTQYRLKRNDVRREYADLIAQQRSALWTSIMGFVGIVGLLVSVVGFWLVFATFRETRRTAAIAQRNLEAFEDAERAVIKMVPPMIFHADGEPRIKLRFKNVGRGHAIIQSVEWSEISTPIYPEALTISAEPPNFLLEPQADGQIGLCPISESYDEVLVAGVLRYRSFTQTFATHFCISVPMVDRVDEYGEGSTMARLRRCRGMPADT